MVPGAAIRLSHEIGRIGLLERENATIINACLRAAGGATSTAAFARSIAEPASAAPVFLSQNDGTLMDVDYAARYPVATFASGPTNSMRGAAFLSGLEDCAVVDVGGTTTDVGMLASAASRARRRSRSTSAACARTSACPTCSRSGSAAAAWSTASAPRSGRDSVGYG